ncbi:hypothetical protein ElyMa_001111500 [Elysia marginata]|uniref:Uncharacterized protein n=1 Tax=Elysia marginata TaxID=1093978 RepID=A0AAV4HZ43_9GAST|nr:hypothetical protein ElyMa_001111500 [Elysia marginata]
MQCHVNVKSVPQSKASSMLYSMYPKGADQATFQLQEEQVNDEISNYINARYIVSTMAARRIFDKQLHERHTTIGHLSVHLENGQRVHFTRDTAAQAATNDTPKTALTSFFWCATDDFAEIFYTLMCLASTPGACHRKIKQEKKGR